MIDRPPITILCRRFWPDSHGGVERCLRAIAHGFAARSIPTHVVCENRTRSPAHERLSDGVTVHRADPPRVGPLWRAETMLRVAWWMRAIRRHAARGHLWAAEPVAAVAAALLGRRRDLIFNPACCTEAMRAVHRAYPHVDSMSNPWLLRRLDHLAARFSPLIFVGSDNLRRQIAEHHQRTSNVHVVPHGGDIAEPSSRQPPTRDDARATFDLDEYGFVIGFAGRLDPCKDIPFLFRAAAAMPLREHDHVLIVGDGPDRERLDRIAGECGLTDRIIWAGRVDDPSALYPAMDVLVLPSVYEAFGNVLVEAMHHGVPVIARSRDSDPARPVLTAAREVIDHERTGFIVDPHDPADLAARLAALRGDAGLRASMSAAARVRAERFTWDRAVDAYLDVLEGRADVDLTPVCKERPIGRHTRAA